MDYQDFKKIKKNDKVWFKQVTFLNGIVTMYSLVRGIIWIDNTIIVGVVSKNGKLLDEPYHKKMRFEQLELLDEEHIEMIPSRYRYYTDEFDDASNITTPHEVIESISNF